MGSPLSDWCSPGSSVSLQRHAHNHRYMSTHAVTGDRVETKYEMITEAWATPAVYMRL